MKHRLLVNMSIVSLLTCAPVVRAEPPARMVSGCNGVVASDSTHASQAGVEILKAGGNAIDAAVAVSFALGVTRPYSTGLGGGGFMIIRLADGRVTVLDYRETAPAAADKEMFAQRGNKDAAPPWPASIHGHRAVAVPGLLAGLTEARERFGSMPLARLVEPAARLAGGGYPVDEDYVKRAKETLGVFEKYPDLCKRSEYVYRVHLCNGQPRGMGDKIVQPELAGLLEDIARHGADFFYRGPVAKALAQEMREHGGLITETDLANYEIRERAALRSTYRGYELITMPPPSSGGIALIETLNILETFDLPTVYRRDPLLAIHDQILAMKHAFADRARWLGDTDFAMVPVAQLTSKAYARTLAATIGESAPKNLDSYGSVNFPDDGGTSHYCVADRFGNVVAATETINDHFGSLAAVEEWGLILNNEMDDFVSRPGEPNLYGLIQDERNAIVPGKRPLSSMTPTIVMRTGSPYLLLGASGGPRIISSVLNVLLGVTDHGMSLEQAMTAMRPHHQWRPDRTYFDEVPPATVIEALTKRGHVIDDERKTGVVQAIIKTEDGWLAASDPRKGGHPAGY